MSPNKYLQQSIHLAPRWTGWIR